MSHRSVPLCAIAALLSFAGPVHGQESEPTASDHVRQADSAYQAGEWPVCAEHYARASSMTEAGAHSTASYNAACCYALAGDADAAFGELARAIEAGYRDLAHIEQDSDLSALHQDPRWKAVLADVAAAGEAYRATINVELLELFEQDQADRQPGGGIDWSEVGPRDTQRRARVAEIMAAGGEFSADDYYHAALVFQHGSEVADIQQANAWAVRAAQLDPDHGSAKWLAAASEDRSLMYQDKPQKYGTQFRRVDGRWILWEVDPTVTDEERAKWNVPPLHEAQARAAAMNGGD